MLQKRVVSIKEQKKTSNQLTGLRFDDGMKNKQRNESRISVAGEALRHGTRHVTPAVALNGLSQVAAGCCSRLLAAAPTSPPWPRSGMRELLQTDRRLTAARVRTHTLTSQPKTWDLAGPVSKLFLKTAQTFLNRVSVFNVRGQVYFSLMWLK